MKRYLFYFSAFLLMSISVNIAFTKGEKESSPTVKTLIVPRRATEVELKNFLRKLNALREDYELVEFSPSDISEYKNICGDPKTKKREDCGESYHTLWIADINNDGKPDYVWTDEVEGSGHFDYLEVYDDTVGGGIVRVEMPKFKCDYSNIDRKLFSVEGGKTYFHLVAFIAQDKEGKILSSGANSNAAKGAYYAVMKEYKCLWSQGHVKVVEKKESKEKYE